MKLSRIPMLLAALGVIGFGIAAFLSPSAQAETTVNAGDLIRGESFPAVYYMGEDGFRYVFPNDKAFFTWYNDFDDVVWISDAELASIQIGGNVTYKPGAKMIKINTDPKTYTVERGGTLRHVTSESLATALYGSDWNSDIDDVPDGFFSNYVVGEPIETTSDMSEAICFDLGEPCTYDISEDKSLEYYATLYLAGGLPGYEGNNIVTIDAGETVRFQNGTSTEDKHTATSDDGSWGTGTVNSGGGFVRRFDEPGTYTFYCSYHPDMTGTIIVE